MINSINNSHGATMNSHELEHYQLKLLKRALSLLACEDLRGRLTHGGVYQIATDAFQDACLGWDDKTVFPPAYDEQLDDEQLRS
jgi:hypothetical protein